MGLFKLLGNIFGGQDGQSRDNNTDLQNLDDEAISAGLRDLAKSGRKIEAIKEARKAYNLGLKEAKDLIEKLEN